MGPWAHGPKGAENLEHVLKLVHFIYFINVIQKFPEQCLHYGVLACFVVIGQRLTDFEPVAALGT